MICKELLCSEDKEIIQTTSKKLRLRQGTVSRAKMKITATFIVIAKCPFDFFCFCKIAQRFRHKIKSI